MGAWGKSAVVVTAILLFLLSSGTLWGEDPKKEPTSTEIPTEMKEKPAAMPAVVPGYLPGIVNPSPYGILGLGPTTGPLAPYGNPAAYDSLQRGWRSHRVGKLILTPYFAVDGLYRSNIFLTPTNKESDFIIVLTPGLRVELPLAGRHRLSVGYLGSGFIYTGFSDQSHYDQNINLDMALNFRGGTSLRFGNTFRIATEERNSAFAVRRRYWRTTPYLTIARAFADRWRVQGAYQYDTLLFTKSRDRFNDYNQHNAGITLFYRFLPKTAALVEYIFIYREYPSVSQDSNYSHSPLVGLTWDPTAKITGAVKFGYTFKQYETDSAGRNNTPDGWIVAANLVYRYSRYTNLTLRAQRSFQEDVDFGNEGFRSSGVWVTLSHDWHYWRVLSYVSFFYLNDDYLNETFGFGGQSQRRNDDIIGFGGGLSRPITRWLRARVDYNYYNRSSNVFGYTYNDHRVIFGVQTSF